MSGAGRRVRQARRGRAAGLLVDPLRSLTRLGVTAAAAALVAVATMVAAVLTVSPAPARAGGPAAGGPRAAGASAQAPVPLSVGRRAAALAAPASSAAPGTQAAAPLTLTTADRRDCPAAATACADLARHITWLQSGGKVTFGPVRMEPGQPGSAHQTPQGTFHVAWKAGPDFVSNIYHDAMPWATFFAAGGIAFHGGSLTQWSHGCVHLTMANARYYNVHLPVGAEVVVF
jgi:lipoprotein-anchoring transpeptidase ErfK/SrfK